MNVQGVELRGDICMNIHIALAVEQKQGRKLQKADFNEKGQW